MLVVEDVDVCWLCVVCECVVWLLEVGLWCYFVDFFGLVCGDVLYVFVEVYDYCVKCVIFECYEFGCVDLCWCGKVMVLDKFFYLFYF